MTIQEATEILRKYNEWRRGANTPQPDPKLIGIAIDAILNYVELSKEFSPF